MDVGRAARRNTFLGRVGSGVRNHEGMAACAGVCVRRLESANCIAAYPDSWGAHRLGFYPAAQPSL